jgi:hypothetical protein
VNGIEECGRALEGNGSYSRAADLFWEAYGRVDPSAVDAADTINSLQGMANAVSSLIVNHCQQQVAATVFVTTYDLLTGVVEFSDACECPVEQMVHFDIAQ